VRELALQVATKSAKIEVVFVAENPKGEINDEE